MPYPEDPWERPPEMETDSQGEPKGQDKSAPRANLTPSEILQAEYDKDVVRQEQIAAAKRKVAHNSSVKQLYAFIIVFSLCCTSCGIFSYIETKDQLPAYSYDLVERRVVRLYQTGYDPIMEPSAREEWLAEHNQPLRIEVVRVTHSPNSGPAADVLILRGDKLEYDSLYFNYGGLLTAYRPNIRTYYQGDATRTFTDAAIDIDPSLYPTSAEEIPESFRN